MDVQLFKDSQNRKVNRVIITLKNGNMIEIDEESECTIQLRNITAGNFLPGYSFSISPINCSAIDITPEG
jgi:hypothetical protein